MAQQIVEIKNSFLDFLQNAMTPLVYEGIAEMYAIAKSQELKIIELNKSRQQNEQIENQGCLKFFQKFLLNIPNLNKEKIEIEATRVRDGSKCADSFDNLVRAVIKSSALIYYQEGYVSSLNVEELVKKVDISSFIHKTYIECAKQFYNYPELFWHGFSSIDTNKNKRESFVIIREAIKTAVGKLLPIKQIVDDFLNSTKFEVEIEQSENSEDEGNENVIERSDESYGNYDDYEEDASIENKNNKQSVNDNTINSVKSNTKIEKNNTSDKQVLRSEKMEIKNSPKKENKPEKQVQEKLKIPAKQLVQPQDKQSIAKAPSQKKPETDKDYKVVNFTSSGKKKQDELVKNILQNANANETDDIIFEKQNISPKNLKHSDALYNFF